jgi:predicted dienelactone hydrolase
MLLRTLLAGLGLAGALISPTVAATLGTQTWPADGAGEAVTLFYPTAEAGRPEQRGDVRVMLAPQATPAPGNGRLIAISHGSGGGPWAFTALAQALVDAGFTVVLPLHRGDSWADPGGPGPDSWKQRPAEISHAIDRVAADPRFAGLRLDRVGMFGMSAGGHTALSLAGGVWSPERFRAHCERHLAEDFHTCVGLTTRLTGGPLDGLKQWVAQRVLNARFSDATPQRHEDRRIAAVVAGVPLAADFDPATLVRPRVPLGLITASGDLWLRPMFHSTPLLAACTGCEHLADLPGGHGALLAPTPAPAELSALACALLCDPPGYDRPAFTALWVGRTVDFFRRHLLAASASLDDQHRQVGVGEHLLGLAAQQQGRHTAAAVRGHDDEVHAFVLGVVDDGFPRVNGLDRVSPAGQPFGCGGGTDGLHPLGGDAVLRVDELLRRHRLDLGHRAVGERLHDTQRQQLGAMHLGQGNGGVDCVPGDVGTVRRDEDALEHSGLQSLR